MNYAELLNLDTGNLTSAADAAGVMANQLESDVESALSFSDIGDGVWKGDDAVAAANSLRDQVPALEEGAQAMHYGKVVLIDLVDQLNSAKEQLMAAHDAAAGTPLIITADGAVVVPPGLPPLEDLRYKALAATVSTMIDAAVTAANNADNAAVGALEGYGGPGGAPPGAAPATMPSEDWSAQQNRDWWDGLSDAERRFMLENHPSIVAGMDGVPAVDRDIASRTLLANGIEDTRRQIEELELHKSGLRGPGAQTEWYAVQAEIDDLNGRLGGMEAIQDRLNTAGLGEYDERAYLMNFDPSGDGQAIVAIGNPDTAQNVLTSVPGTGADVATIGGDITRTDRMVFDANMRSDESTAGIMWLGYDAPDTLAHAALPSYAANATSDLQSFQDGLHVANGSGANYTMMGHSYGSTVVGHAGTDGGVATDQMIFVGSPGVGADHASDLGIGAENVYATTAPNDAIHVVPDASWAHNTAPVKEEFGARVFESPRYDGSRGEAHSGYWDDGHPAREAFADIITGNGDAVNHDDYHKRWYQWRPWG